MTERNIPTVMFAVLGAQAKQERLRRSWSLPVICAVLEDMGAGKLDPGTIKRMEDGERPGDTRVWGKMWEALELPLVDLYRGLGLPAVRVSRKDHLRYL